MAKLQPKKTAGFNAGNNVIAKSVPIDSIKIDPKISEIFKISDQIKEEIKQRINKFGYDKNQPALLWKGHDILVDGHTRVAAAKEAGLTEIPVTEREFESLEDVLIYVFERQAIPFS
jgi:ParB family chromosome partitioning protein